MKTAIAVTGAPENALFARAAAVMGRFYNLPSASWVSTESMCADAQAALEKSMGFFAHLACRVIWTSLSIRTPPREIPAKEAHGEPDRSKQTNEFDPQDYTRAEEGRRQDLM